MTEIEMPDWQQRQDAAAAEAERKRAERRQTRRGFDARRDLGLERRHAEKAARLEAAAVIDEGGRRCHYLVSEAPARLCPNERLPGAEFCRPHLVRAVELARRLGLELS